MEESAAAGSGRQASLFADPAPADSATLAAPPQHAEHPRANRELQLGACRIRYELRRAQRRSIGFTVSPEGLSVSAPRALAESEIEAALQGKRAWILRKLAEQAQRAQALQRSRVAWGDGALLPVLGTPVRIVLGARRGLVVLQEAPAPAGEAVSRELQLGLPPGASPQDIGEAVRRWLLREARRVFEARLAHFAPQLGVRCTRLSLSSARTRWGSASAQGAIRLNWRLVHLALPLIDYVVVHELAHLREMNHGPRFWALVASVLPDYAQARDALRHSLPPLLD